MQHSVRSLSTLAILALAGCTAKPPSTTLAPLPQPQQIGEQPFLLIPTRPEPADISSVPWEAGAHVSLTAKARADLPTEASIFSTRQNLYLTFRCAEPSPDNLIVQPKDIWNRDCVELFIEPEQNLIAKPYHHVIIDAAGHAIFERCHVYPRHYQLRAFEEKWNPNAEIAVANSADHWTCTLRIPLADLHIGDSAKAGGLWRLNFCRTRPARDKEPGITGSWSNLGPNGFQAPSRFGYAIPASYVLHDLQSRIAAADAAAPRDLSVPFAADPGWNKLVDQEIEALSVGGPENAREHLDTLIRIASLGDAAYAVVTTRLAAKDFNPATRPLKRNFEYILTRDRPDEDPPPQSLRDHIARFAPHTQKDAQNRELQYRLFTPTLAPNQKVPLVIFLHGSAEKGDDNRHQLFGGGIEYGNDKIQNPHPCFILVPQCPILPPNSGWADTRSNPESVKVLRASSNYRLAENPNYVTTLLHDAIDKTLADNPAIDKNRIYIAGSSMGGFGAYEMIERYPEQFAAAVVLCGGGDETRAASIAQIPLWDHHGTLDDHVKVQASRNMIEALKKAGGHPRYTEYPDRGHALGEPNLDLEVLEWMFAQHKK
jgi:predicted esterase